MSPRTGTGRVEYRWLAILPAYIPLLFMGYGTEVDTYGVLDTAHGLLYRGVYHPSRNPGFFLYESLAGLMSIAGGAPLCNAFSLLAAGAAGWALIDIGGHLRIRNAGLLAACFLINPYVAMAATTTMDYLPALACCLLSVCLMQRGRWRLGAAVAGVAIGFRISSGLPILAGGVSWAFFGGQQRRIAEAAAICCGVAAFFYIPPFAAEGWQMFNANHNPFIDTGQLRVSLALRLGKFSYKNLYMSGLLAGAFLAICLLVGRPRLRWSAPAAACALAIMLEELLFLDAPAKPFYLIPCLSLGLLLIGLSTLNRKEVLVPFLALTASYSLVDVPLAQPNIRSRATAAKFAADVEKGLLIKHIESRLKYVGCADAACWVERMKLDPNR